MSNNLHFKFDRRFVFKWRSTRHTSPMLIILCDVRYERVVQTEKQYSFARAYNFSRRFSMFFLCVLCMPFKYGCVALCVSVCMCCLLFTQCYIGRELDIRTSTWNILIYTICVSYDCVRWDLDLRYQIEVRQWSMYVYFRRL